MTNDAQTALIDMCAERDNQITALRAQVEGLKNTNALMLEAAKNDVDDLEILRMQKGILEGAIRHAIDLGHGSPHSMVLTLKEALQKVSEIDGKEEVTLDIGPSLLKPDEATVQGQQVYTVEVIYVDGAKDKASEFYVTGKELAFDIFVNMANKDTSLVDELKNMTAFHHLKDRISYDQFINSNAMVVAKRNEVRVTKGPF